MSFLLTTQAVEYDIVEYSQREGEISTTTKKIMLKQMSDISVHKPLIRYICCRGFKEKRDRFVEEH